MKFQLPFQKTNKFPITQLFGERFLYRGQIVSHKGVDWAMPKFTPLLAPFSGVVVRIEKTRTYGYGRTVYLRCQDKKLGKVEALLAHCENIIIKLGDNVKMGNKVAYSGNSGFWRGRNGYHLHFGLKINGIYVNPLNYVIPNESKEHDNNLFSKNKGLIGDYVVKKGDTLWSIAETFYENGTHYVDIYNSNQDILKNPNKIFPGQRLRIPTLKDKGL